MEADYVFQLVNISAGSRSPALQTTKKEFAEQIHKMFPVERHTEFAVLVLLDKSKNEDWDFSQVPFLRVDNFLKLHLEGYSDG